MSTADVKREDVKREMVAEEHAVHVSRFHVPPQDIAIFALLVVATFALYARTAHFDFVNFDDGDYVYDNAWVKQGITADGISWAFTTSAASNWHPLTWLSLMLDVSLFGVSAGAIHLVNAALHALNAGLLFLVLSRMTWNRWPSAWVAAMFAVHPLHVESVAWIAERKDVLSTTFWMLCTLAYVSYVRNRTMGRYALVLVLLALGLMTKPMVVTLPFVLLLLDYWPLGRVDSAPREDASDGEAPRRDRGRLRLRGIILEKLPMLTLVVASAIATYLAQSAGRAVASTRRFPLDLRIANAVISYGEYLLLTIVPRGLAIYYPHPANVANHPPLWPAVTISAIVLATITAVAFAMRRRMPWWIVGWLWYLGTLVPVIGIVQVGGQARADRYTYVPLIGIFIATAWTVCALAKRSAPLRALAGAGGIVTVLVAAALTWVQLGYWRNGETVWRRAIAVVPDNYVAHGGLGQFLDEQGKTDAAREEFETAIRINPNEPTALNDLGVQASRAGDFDRAAELYRRAIRIDPYFGGTYYNYGNVLDRQGKPDEAERAYRRAGELGYPRGYHAQARLLAARGKLQEAIPLWEKALRMDPTLSDAHHAMGMALLMQGENQNGFSHLRAALGIDPHRADTLSALAWAMATHPNPAYQDGVEAERLARRAIELSKSPDPHLLDTLAAALARQRKFDEAANVAQQAADLAQRQGADDLAAAIRNRLQLYRSGHAYTSGR
jgi:tetratricopeptide (TPR) repeat protein